MALLVPDNGELQTLRYLVNNNRNVPRNLILKLFSSNTTPAEGSVPSQSAFYEPYDGTGNLGYGVAPTNGYPAVINNRNGEDYSSQYGILLDGNRWNVRTITTAIATTNGSGNINEYTITVTDTTGIAVGHYVSGGGVGANATVAAIDGNTLVLTVKNASNFIAQSLSFGVGTTTASYAEQTFTFTSAASNIYGYYLVRANNMPADIHGVADVAHVYAEPGIAKTGTTGTIGESKITLFDKKYEPNATGIVSAFEFIVDNIAGISTSQRVIGSGVGAGARVVGFTTDVVYVDKPNSGTVSGVTTFFDLVTNNVTLGMGVTHTAAGGETNAFPAGTVVTGIDELSRTVYLNNALLNNIQAATGDTVTFNAAGIAATSHGLVSGDVIYIAQGTDNVSTASSTYTVFSTTDDSFTTTPALEGSGAATLYSSIMLAERFTNGPYNVQNNGDQIKVTLNISLD